jgi:ATP-binding cassette subfamily C protein
VRHSLSALVTLLRLAPAWETIVLGLLLLAAATTEGIGVLLLVPLLGLLQGGASSHPFTLAFNQFLAYLGLPVSVGTLLVIFLALVLVRSIILFTRSVLSARLQHSLVDRLRGRCLEGILNADWRWLLTHRHSDITNILMSEVNRVGMSLQRAIGLATTTVTLLAFLVVAFTLSWRMSLFASLCGIAMLAALGGHRKRAEQLGRDLGQANRRLQGAVQDSLAGLKLARIQGAEHRHLGQFLGVLQVLRHRQMAFLTSSSLAQGMLQTGGAAMLAVYLYVGLTTLKTPLPELLTLVFIVARLIPLFASAQQQLHQWLHALPALQETQEFLEQCREQEEHESPGPPMTLGLELRLEGIRYTHTGNKRPTLDELSLVMPARTSIAIQGDSGAGKSTLADLLSGLLSPDQGALLVDGERIGPGRRRAWRRRVAYVPQDPFLLHDSVRNNLLWAHPGADEQELYRAVELASAGFIHHLPEGLDTLIGDGGTLLSGGERQRLALARALLRQPDLLILDEATSALDPANEARIRDALSGLHGRIGIILLGHHLDRLGWVDQRYLLQRGRLHTLPSEPLLEVPCLTPAKP